MFRSLITILLIFTFVAPALAGIGHCEMSAQGCADEMACCRQAQAVTGSAAARLCCEVFCGEPLDKEAETTSNAPLSANIIVSVSAFPPSPILVLSPTAQVNLVIRVVNASPYQHRSPPLFLSHSAFLI